MEIKLDEWNFLETGDVFFHLLDVDVMHFNVGENQEPFLTFCINGKHINLPFETPEIRQIMYEEIIRRRRLLAKSPELFAEYIEKQKEEMKKVNKVNLDVHTANEPA